MLAKFHKVMMLTLTLTTQNLISSSLHHLQPILKISSKSVHKFLSNVANRCTNKVTDKEKKNKLPQDWGGENKYTRKS